MIPGSQSCLKGIVQYFIRIPVSRRWNTMDHFSHYAPWSPGNVSSWFSIILSNCKGFKYCMIIGLMSQRTFDCTLLILSFTICIICNFRIFPLTSISNVLPEVQCGEEGWFSDSPELCVALTVVMQELDSREGHNSNAHSWFSQLPVPCKCPFHKTSLWSFQKTSFRSLLILMILSEDFP